MSKAKERIFQRIDPQPIKATPVKSFFVSMLTRDISLEDAILDLLDNCIDGLHRSVEYSKRRNENNPYRGFKAEITFSGKSFSISDNCGGIPWEQHDYAFRMGRDKDRALEPGSLGTFGIGMKRAIFKMGEHCRILSRNGEYQYQIEITPEWLKNDNWNLVAEYAEWPGDKDGTLIEVWQLHEGIAKQFDEYSDKFLTQLTTTVSTHFAYIIGKGFEIKINGSVIVPRPITIAFDIKTDEQSAYVRPFIFQKTPENGEEDGVDVFLTVGFWRPPPTESEIDDESNSPKNSAENAGWTIVCNDRVVVFNDKTILTGWGDSGVPRYHNQFIAISGIVEFRSNDPRKLPTTTTKRGLDASSHLYLQVRQKMCEGVKIFTQYTNDWKKREDEARKKIISAEKLPFTEIKKKAQNLELAPTPKIPGGSQYKPNLPKPATLEPKKKRISFVKEVVKIEIVAEYFGVLNQDPSEIGEKCFDLVYQEARK
jgi:hypothetical protein